LGTDPKDLSIRDEVTVETEIDGAFVNLSSFVTNVLADEIWLALRLPDPRLATLTDGQAIHLSFDRAGVLIVESVFLRRLGSHAKLGMEKSRVFAVRRPRGLDNAQRRAHVRVDLERMVRIRSLAAAGRERMGTGKTMNIGAGGVQFSTEMPLGLGEQLRLALVLTSRDIVVAGGPIVRIDDHVEPGAHQVEAAGAVPLAYSRVAMRFDKISDVDQERIACHILSAHRKRVSGGDDLPKGIELAVDPEAATPGPEVALAAEVADGASEVTEGAT
jgi:c-di-GMP-binding flagellar brake protein YcgR